MEKDFFENEQRIYDNALNRMAEVAVKAGDGAQFDFAEYSEIAKEYGKLLTQLRQAARLPDGTVIDLHESNLDLTDKVYYDALTGIYNKRYVEDNLKRIIKTMVRSNGGLLSVLMIDIDFFNNYNDAYGHSEGDVCLKTISKILSASVMRPEDFAARYGSEEFAVVLPNTNENGARVIAKKIIENVHACGIPHKKSDAGRITVSIGVTTAHVDLAYDGSDFIKRAEEALHISKENGRNQFTYLVFEEAVYEV